MNSHASHGHDRKESNLAPLIHVQPPNQKHRQNGKSKVANDAERAIKIRKGNDDLNVETGPLRKVLVPEEIDGRALEECDEEENDAGKDGDGHDAPDDELVDSTDGDAEEEVADGDLGGDHGAAVPEVAEPPVLKSSVNESVMVEEG